MDYVVVAVVGLLAGGFCIPVGFALGLDPLGIFLAGACGSLVGMAPFLLGGGDEIRSRLLRGRAVPGDDNPRVRAVRPHGPRWLGLVGPTFPGVTAGVVLGLASGLDPGRLARPMSIGIAGL